MSVHLFTLHTTKTIPVVGKDHTCFLIDSKHDQIDKCVKSRIMTKVIDCVLFIDTFEQQCAVLKGMLQSPRIKYHMKTIDVDQSLSNSDLVEHRCI